MKRPRKQDPPTADKILETATPLFYRRGLAAVSLDEIATGAKMTKRTLYYHYPTKDDLVLAYLRRWYDRTQARFRELNKDADAGGAETVLAAFRELEREAARAGFRGCPFVNAVAEINDRTHPVTHLAIAHKEGRRQWFESLVRKDKISGAKKLSEQLMALWEGAVVRALVTGNAKSVGEAREAAATLLASRDCARGA